MPVAKFQMPDGRIARFQVPDGTTPEQAQSMIADFDFSTIEQKSSAPAQPKEPSLLDDAKQFGKTALRQTAGTAASAIAGAAGFLPDLAKMATDPIRVAASQGVEALGFPETAQSLQPSREYPTETIKRGLSRLTDGYTDPKSDAERISYRATEFLSPGVALAKGGAKLGQLAGTKSAPYINQFIASQSTKTAPEALAALGGGAGFEVGNILNEQNIGGGFAPILGALAGGSAATGITKTKEAIQSELKGLSKKKVLTSAEQRAMARPFYKSFTDSGGVYSPKLTNELADAADAARPTGIAGKLKPEDESLSRTLDFYSGLRNIALSPEDLQKLDQSLADDVARFNKAGEYNFGRILNDIKYELRNKAFNPKNAVNYIESGDPEAINNLLEANRLWQQSYKTKDIETIIKKAQGTENPQTSIRTGLKNLLANDKKIAMYTPKERKALEEALKRGYAGGLIKLFGGRLTDSIGGGMAGMAAGGPVGAIAGVVAGKALGGGMADLAGDIQANRLIEALQNIQSGKVPVNTKNKRKFNQAYYNLMQAITAIQESNNQ